MRKILKNILAFATIGVFIGMIISIVISYFYHSFQYYPSAPAFVARFTRPLNAVAVSFLLWIIIGQLFGFGSLIFEIKHWSLRKKTIINFLTYYLGLIPLALLAGWFPLTWPNFLLFTVIFIVVYTIIWLINWRLVLADINKVNQKVKEKQNK